MQVFARFFLGITGLVFAGLGVFNLLFPVHGIIGFEIFPSTISALNEIRANYGGMHLALGLFFLSEASIRPLRAPALLVAALFTGGLVAGRLVSLVWDGKPNPFVWTLFSVECVGCLVASALYNRTLRMAESHGQEVRGARS